MLALLNSKSLLNFDNSKPYQYSIVVTSHGSKLYTVCIVLDSKVNQYSILPYNFSPQLSHYLIP